MAGKPRNLGLSYIDKTGVRRWREWRGIKDTLVDYGWWCVMWKDMIKFVLQSPLQVVKGIFRYRWMLTYLTLPQFIDRQLEGMRGVQLRAGHALYDIIIKHTIDIIADSFNADQNIGGKKSLADRIVCFDELVPTELMAGLPTYCLGVPLRYNDDVDAQKYAVEELRGCIKFIEEHTGEKFDWDAFAKALESYNEVTRFHLDLWEINRTDHPQVTGPTPWLYRMYTYHLHGGMDQRFNKADKRVHKLMTEAYEKRLPCSAEMRHKALVWSCPANYYTNFSNWLEQCWGIVSVMDMETHISQVIIDTSTPETMLEGVALTYQRATMRKHTKGGYRNAVDEMWRVAEEYNVDTIIMYDQISCKGMDGLQGIFDEQARERNINFIWVQQDLMDPRTISRRDMRRQVNQYMTSVLRETPVDPTLLDFDDCDAF